MNLEDRTEQTEVLSPQQHSAIRHSIRIGGLLVNDHPEIADMYREGRFHPEIAEILDVEGNYGGSDNVARNSIHHAITGHTGGFGIEPYDGLIQDVSELVRLEYKHYVGSGKIIGRKSAEAINPKTGERHVVEAGRIGGRKGVLARGLTPWGEEERRDAYLMSQEPEYQHQKEPNKGKSDNNKIKDVLNIRYHGGEEVRSAMAVNVNLYKYRKSLQK